MSIWHVVNTIVLFVLAIEAAWLIRRQVKIFMQYRRLDMFFKALEGAAHHVSRARIYAEDGEQRHTIDELDIASRKLMAATNQYHKTIVGGDK